MIRVVKGNLIEWGSCSHTVSSNSPIALSYWGNTIAVGCRNSDITILDAITGSQIAVLAGHASWVRSVTFSSDGRSLASGSDDFTVKLWDVQTGGVIKTFHGHSHVIFSVSISGDCTRIASGSEDCTIHLWDIQRGECLHTIKQQSGVRYVCFSPTDPHHIISISGDKVQEWGTNSQKISSLYDATSLAFSPNHSQLALCYGVVITVWNFNSGEMVAQSNVASVTINHCCFSPDGKLLAAATNRTAYIWDITSPDFHLVETFVGHAGYIDALIFSSPSSLISASDDDVIRFWQIGALPKNQTATGSGSTLLASPPVISVSLQTTAGIAISSDMAGIAKIWDLSTGLCKASLETPVGDCGLRDIQLISGRLIIVWYKSSQIHIWDTNKNEFMQAADVPKINFLGIRISGDGSKVFLLTKTSIQAWSIDTGKHLGEMELGLGGGQCLDPLQMDGSRIWIQLKNSSTQGWDFGIPGSSPAILPTRSAGRPILEFIGGPWWQTHKPSWIQDTVGKKKVFQLSGKYAKPSEIQWDGQYLVAGYKSGEVLIVAFHNMYPQ